MSASAGRVLLMPKGDYDNTVTYSVLDWVRYNEASYVCKQTSLGHLPTDTTYWQMMVQDGTSPNTKLSYEDNGIIGAKNLIKIEPQSQTLEGIDYTIYDDGTVLVDGTSTANGSYLQLYRVTLPAGSYIKTGCPAGGSTSTYFFGGANTGDDVGSGAAFTLSVSTACDFVIAIEPNTTVSNILFKPMFRLATDVDPTYRPPASTNRELTLGLEKASEDIEDLAEDLDEYTASISPVLGVVTFVNLNSNYGYKLCVDIPDEAQGTWPTSLSDLNIPKWSKLQRSTNIDGTINLAYTVTDTTVQYALRILK